MKKSRLMIVEDEAIVSADIAIRLDELGYEVVGTAAAGEEAIALAERVHPDLVLMDIHLQDAMDGILAAKELRKRLGVPVVFLTAYSEGATIQRAKLAEPLGFILKPFEDRELEVVIEMALYKCKVEAAMRQQTEELLARNDELNRFTRLAVGRELRMIELKRELNGLYRRLGEPPRYVIAEEIADGKVSNDEQSNN
ncbi:MAG: response regulator [Deltaproteobacteria bacterium]